MTDYALGRQAVLQLFGIKIAATKWDTFLRDASVEQLRPYVERFVGSAVPTHYKPSELNQVLKAVRDTDNVDRMALVKTLRQRAKFETPRPMLTGAKRKANRNTVEFARSIRDRAKSPLVDIAHGGVQTELESMLKYGPSGAIGYVPGATGTPELYGAFVHRLDDPLADRLSAYAQRRSNYAGGEPAVLYAKFPRDLLSEAGRIGGGESAIPRSLWKYIQNPVIKKVGQE